MGLKHRPGKPESSLELQHYTRWLHAEIKSFSVFHQNKPTTCRSIAAPPCGHHWTYTEHAGEQNGTIDLWTMSSDKVKNEAVTLPPCYYSVSQQALAESVTKRQKETDSRHCSVHADPSSSATPARLPVCLLLQRSWLQLLPGFITAQRKPIGYGVRRRFTADELNFVVFLKIKGLQKARHFVMVQ